MKEYIVYITSIQLGQILVKAPNKGQAINIAENQLNDVIFEDPEYEFEVEKA